MIPKVIPEGCDCEALPNGQWISTLRGKGKVATGKFDIRQDFFVPAEPFYIRLSPNGEKFDGQAGTGAVPGTVIGRTSDGLAIIDPRIAHGESGAYFDRDSNPIIIEPAANQTSQGYAFLDDNGQPVLGDSVILTPDAVISKYTLKGGIYCGQGHDKGGVIIGRPGDYRVLASGKFILPRFNRFGSFLAVAAWRLPEDGGGSYFWWFDENELPALPKLVIEEGGGGGGGGGNGGGGNGGGDHKVKLPAAVISKLSQERAKFGSPVDPKQIGTILNRTAAAFPSKGPGAVGMQLKAGGTTVAILPDGTTVWNGLRWIDPEGKHWGFDVCGACSVGVFNVVDADGGEADPNTFQAAVAEPSDGNGDNGNNGGDQILDLTEIVATLKRIEDKVNGIQTSSNAEVLALLRKPIEGTLSIRGKIALAFKE